MPGRKASIRARRTKDYKQNSDNESTNQNGTRSSLLLSRINENQRILSAIILLFTLIFLKISVVTAQSNKDIIGSGRFIIGNNEIIFQEGIDRSIIELPDSTTIYYVVILKGPYSPEIEQNLESFGVRVIKPNPYYGYYVFSSVESAKKIANITYIRWIGQIPFEPKFEKDLLQKVKDNPNRIYLVDIVILEVNTSVEAILNQKGKIVADEGISKFYRMQVEGRNLLDIAKLDIVENIELVRETITTEGQDPYSNVTPNLSKKTFDESQKTVGESASENKTLLKSPRMDTFLLLGFSVVIASGVILLMLLRLKGRKINE